ncbi:hypothetical protein C7974DRAFT_201525 [Boeremia exigua]|uniref:uncharacterized protein n=1 Tax=Boeremia exigua TaxID=749465 RepID=UPI001E8EC7CF|nr:uncharacterized protein C7974DRAFT_201525 [Boeremia exigua]KAH6625435.1 hypothetical protein C7974DRAFT_201525 [Boeremia exigua]
MHVSVSYMWTALINPVDTYSVSPSFRASSINTSSTFITMGSRKLKRKATDETVNTTSKRPKASSGTLPTPPPMLFRLPAELRNQIWELAYGTQIIHVALASLNKTAATSHPDLSYTARLSETLPYHETPLRLPPTVSKQFHAETTAAFYATSTFFFTEPHAFRAFALAPHACVPRVARLRIQRLTHHWDDALVCSLLGRLRGLRGVWLTQHVNGRWVPRGHAAKGLWRVVRAFAQFELEAAATRFELVLCDVVEGPDPMGAMWTRRVHMRPGMLGYAEWVGLQRELTQGLLEYTPRRLSRRLAGGG